jgi:hypothetical protein
MIPLGEVAPALQKLRAHMRAPEPIRADLPVSGSSTDCPEDAPVVSRVEQLTERNRINNWVSP